MARIAFDKTARKKDADGRLHVGVSHISKAQVSPYYGSEIPGFESLGLDPGRTYHLLRDPDELAKAAPTFERLPILKKHVPVTVETPQPDLVIGAIGSNVSFESPYLNADLVFWDAEAIAGIETEVVQELSCAYRYLPVMEPGEYEGTHYDGKMTEIAGNHLALVEAGRAGPDVVVADSNNNFRRKEEKKMPMTKLGKAFFAALGAMSPILAADAALPALVGNATRKTFQKKDVVAKLVAMDGTMDPDQIDNVIDALLDVEQPNPVDPNPNDNDLDMGEGDSSPEEEIHALLDGKVDDETISKICSLVLPKAADEAPEDGHKEPDEDDKKEDGMKKKDMEAAMDSLRKSMRDARNAERDVRCVVGDVVGMDSAADIYGFALDQLKVLHEGITDVKALRALFAVASKLNAGQAPKPAMDSAGLASRFPQAARFSRA